MVKTVRFINDASFYQRMNAENNLEDQFQGAIMGAAVGDALGMPTEDITKEELVRLYNGKVTSFEKAPARHPCAHLEAGQYTDDTQQMILLAESLLACKSFDVYDFGQRLGSWAHKCKSVPGYDRYAGGTSMFAGLELHQGVDPHLTGRPMPTCGSGMRVAPLGLFYHSDLPNLREAAVEASSITHTHPAAIDSSIIISYAAAFLVNGMDAEEAIQQSKRYCTSNLVENVDVAIANKHKSPSEAARLIGTSASCYQTIPMALYCFLHSPQDYEEVVVTAANLVPGDTDSIACIAGALAGAHNGKSNIPVKFTEKIEDRDMLLDIASRLLLASNEKV